MGTLGYDTNPNLQCASAGHPFACCTGFLTGVCPDTLALSAEYTNPPVLVMGPGNGANAGDLSTFVPMNDPGEAYNFFVRADNHPGIDFINGMPISYIFALCKNPGTCFPTVICYITDPDTTCNDLVNNTGDYLYFGQGDVMAVYAFSNDFFANTADVTWSVTYDKSIPF